MNTFFNISAFPFSYFTVYEEEPTQGNCNIGNTSISSSLVFGSNDDYLTIRLRARVFYEQIVNEAQSSRLSLVENDGEWSNCFSINLLVVSLHKRKKNVK